MQSQYDQKSSSATDARTRKWDSCFPTLATTANPTTAALWAQIAAEHALNKDLSQDKHNTLARGCSLRNVTIEKTQ